MDENSKKNFVDRCEGFKKYVALPLLFLGRYIK